MILLTFFSQKWLNALKDHITYSTHYMHQGVTGSDEEEILPLGSLQDTLKVSTPPYIMSHSRQQMFLVDHKKKKISTT